MAINYTNIFTMIGSLVKRSDNWRTYYAALDADFLAIENAFVGIPAYDLLSGIPQTLDDTKRTIPGWISQMTGKCSQVLTHRDMVLEQLALGSSSDVRSVLALLYSDMVTNAQTIKASVVTIGSVTATKTNASAGTILLGKVLDGFNVPANSSQANRYWVDADSELALAADTVTVECVRDTNTDRTTDGGELFQWKGSPTTPTFEWQDTGSGTGPGIQPLNVYNYLGNQDFETFTANAPGSWTLDTGTAGVHIFESATVNHGVKALRYLGDAAIAAIQISQAPTAQSLQPLRRYCVSCYIRGTAAMSAGTLTIQFEGTGYTAGATEKITLAFGALAALATYTNKYFFVNMPTQIPSDMKLVIQLTGTPSAHQVLVDDLAFGPVQYTNGIHWSMVRGSQIFVRGDKYVFSVTNDNAGKFSKWFREAYGMQLKSTTGAPSISEALVA